MFNKKICIVLISLFFLIFTLSCVSASQDNLTTDEIALDEMTIESSVEDEGILKDSYNATFKDLNKAIQSAEENTVLKLENDYIYNDSVDNVLSGINIYKSLTIDGQGHSIDAKNNSLIFTIDAKNVILKNIVFKNTKSTELKDNIYLGSIYWRSGSSGKILNSTFINSHVTNGGTLYFFKSNVEIDNCRFINNTAKLLGGAICSEDSILKISNTNFTNNKAYYGGAIFDLNSQLNMTNVNINYNNAEQLGGGIYKKLGNLTISQSKFLNNSAYNGGGLYTSHISNSKINDTDFSQNIAEYKGKDIYLLLSQIDFNNVGYNDMVNTSYLESFINANNYTLIKYNDSNYNGTIPSYFNLVDHGWVTPVKNQGTSGSCWAFASIAALESAILKSTGITYDFSENNLKDVSTRFGDYGTGGLGANTGGYPETALAYFASWLGPIYDYLDEMQYSGEFSPIFLNIPIHVQNALYVNHDNITDNDKLKEAIMRYGAVAVSLNMIDNTNINNNGTIYSMGPHAVTLVGWDDNYSASNFYYNIPPGDGAWIIKNSWGTYRGDNGYYYVSYYDSSFATTGYSHDNNVVYIFNDTISYERVYQHDFINAMFSSNIHYIKKGNEWIPVYEPIYYKNVYYSVSDEELLAFSTYFNEDNEWEVFVYNNDELVHTQNGKAIGRGYFTFNFNKPIPIYKGDEISIVVKMINNNCTPAYPYNYKSSMITTTGGKGISYYSYDGNTWKDLDNDGKVACLKIFTRFNNVTLEEKDIYSNNFRALNNLIKTHDNTTLFLTKDYIFNSTTDLSFVNGINLKKQIIIDGQGHTINANKKTRIFNINSKVVLKNIIFINGFPTSDGGAIYNAGDDVCVMNCSFMNNSANGSGGVIYNSGKNCSVVNCSFMNNSAENGGAVYTRCGGFSVVGCSFVNNSAARDGGAVYGGDNVSVLNCSFMNNSAVKGDVVGNVDSLVNCIFINNTSDKNGIIINGGDDLKININKNVQDNISIKINNKIYQYKLENKEVTVRLDDKDRDRNLEVILTFADENNNTYIIYHNIFSSTVNIDNIRDIIYVADDLKLSFSVVNRTIVRVVIVDGDGKAVYNETTSSNNVVITNLSPGDYTVTVYNQGNEYYSASSDSKMFKVKKADSLIIINDLNPVSYGARSVINFDVVNRTSVSYTLFKDGSKYKDVNVYGSSLDLGVLPVGNYKITFTNHENNYYNEFSISKEFLVSMANSIVELNDVNDIDYGDDLKLSFSVVNRTSVRVVIVDGDGKTVYNKTTSSNNVVITNLSPGDYTVTVYNQGSEHYSASSDSKMFKVKKADSLIIVSDIGQVYYGARSVINFDVVNRTSVSYTLFKDGSKYKDANVYGSSLDLGVLPVGNYNIIFINRENTYYNEFSISKEFLVSMANSIVELNDVNDIGYGDDLKLSFSVVNRTSVRVVIVDGDGKTVYNKTTSSNNVVISNLVPGDYTVTVYNQGSEHYSASSDSKMFKVKKADSLIIINDLNPVSYGARSVINFDIVNRTSVSYTLFKDGNKYKDANVYGYSLDLGVLPVGNYKIIFTNHENNCYNEYTINKEFSIIDINSKNKKLTPKIIAKKKTFKRFKKVKKYSITLKVGKIPLKYVKVYIKIGKKTYKSKTNFKGKATFKIKLKKKGTYKSKIIFKGNKNYKTITKKVKIKIK